MHTSCTFDILPQIPLTVYSVPFSKERLIFFPQLRRTGIPESTEHSLSSKPRAPRTTPFLHLNETKNVEHDGKLICWVSLLKVYYHQIFLLS